MCHWLRKQWLRIQNISMKKPCIKSCKSTLRWVSVVWAFRVPCPLVLRSVGQDAVKDLPVTAILLLVQLLHVFFSLHFLRRW